MSDKTYLDWPFFEDAHRTLERDVDAWAAKNLSHAGHGSDVAAACRTLVRDLVRAWRATNTSSKARRPGFPTAALPTSTACSHAPARPPGHAASALSWSMPI